MSSDRNIRYATSYNVGDGEVRLRVTVGDGQFGSSLVTLGETLVGHERTIDTVLGKGAELAGKALQIFSVVTDTNTQTNRTSVSYRLEGGPAVLEHTLECTVSKERESVDYKADIKLVRDA